MGRPRHRLVDSAAASFFSHPAGNATDIMWEPACEGVGRCNTDMKSFKGYLSRFMYSSTLMLPSLTPAVRKLLDASAAAAAAACSGAGDQCGQKWYVGGFDDSVGLGQQMCALETIQGLLVDQAAPPLTAAEIKDVRSTAASSPTSSPSPTKRSNNAAGATATVELRCLALSVLAGPLSLLRAWPLRGARFASATSPPTSISSCCCPFEMWDTVGGLHSTCSLHILTETLVSKIQTTYFTACSGANGRYTRPAWTAAITQTGGISRTAISKTRRNNRTLAAIRQKFMAHLIFERHI